MNRTKTMVAAAVLGMMAGAAACGGSQAEAKNPRGPGPAPTVPMADDKSACGNHDGGSCGAVLPSRPPG